MGKSGPIADLLPHDGDMVLIDKLIEQRDGGVTTGLQVRQDGLFDRNDRVPAWVGIEYMAQTIGVYAGLLAKQAGEPVKLGLLLGTRRYETNCAEFACGANLKVTADEVLRGDDGLSVFECTITGEGVLVAANLNVFQPADAEVFLQEEQLQEGQL